MKVSVSGGSGGGAKKKLGVQRPQAAAAKKYTTESNSGRRAGRGKSLTDLNKLEMSPAYMKGFTAGRRARG